MYANAHDEAVHATFRLVIEVLGNCATPANVPGGKQHLDLIAANCEASIWQYVRSLNGTVEPQSRKTEHMHARLQVLGLTNPREYFLGGEFLHTSRQVWS